MDLIVVESPTKAKTLSRFLGKGYHVLASMGHIRDLPEKKLGIDIEHDFKPTYEVSSKKKEKVTELQGEASKADRIILATDPDREGEAIAFHLNELIGKKAKVERITFHEITESAIKDALAHSGTINMQLVDAQQARRILDRLVGYKLSPLLWRKVRKGLSAGRVQSVAVRLIVEREREVLAFKATEYWEIEAKLEKGKIFSAKLVKIDDKSVELPSKEVTDEILNDLSKEKYLVKAVNSKQVKRSPYPPFTTSKLQQASSNLFGWSAKKTMQVAQNLYERGFITYHRTDSTNMAVEAVSMAREFIEGKYGKEYLSNEPRLYKTKSKVAQEAHEAIRPTSVNDFDEKVGNSGLDRDQIRLYELIWRRFLATQMSEVVFDQRSIEISAGKYLFRASGSKIVFSGWQILNEKTKKDEIDEIAAEDDNSSGESDQQNLPDVKEGDTVNLKEILPTQHFTQPPARYTEASLIKILEEYGIGRPSTYAPTISTILDRQYVEKVEKKFVPTNLGFAVNDFLVTNFPQIFEYSFTAKMEDELDSVANGEKEWVPVISEFYSPFEEILAKVSETAERVKVDVETTDEVCPNDGAPLIVRIGKFGKFLACSKFPDCKYTARFQQKLEVKCPKCGIGDVLVKRTKTKKSFYGCSRYPECDFASWNKPKVEEVGEQKVEDQKSEEPKNES